MPFPLFPIRPPDSGKKLLWLCLLLSGVLFTPVTTRASDMEEIRSLAADPSIKGWAALSQFDGAMTRAAFENALHALWDPEHGMDPYLDVSNECVRIYSGTDHTGLVAVVRFAPDASHESSASAKFRNPARMRSLPPYPGKPLAGLKIAIDPADIGGKWAEMEDRSVQFHGHGTINEGDLNVVVGKLLRDRLAKLGATVLLVRKTSEPVLDASPWDIVAETRHLLQENPDAVPSSMHALAVAIERGNRSAIARQADQLYTKTLESRAREALIRRTFQPDLTIVLQHDATADSAEGKLTPQTNRNIFFVSGMYQKAGLASASNRYRLLRKLLEDVTPTETTVAGAISDVFASRTGFPAVMYGNSEVTRLMIAGNNFVVARNLMFTREHDGPTVVTEPYFMNHPVTIERLLAGDYEGTRKIAGQMRPSIFREYADCVADGIVKAYGR